MPAPQLLQQGASLATGLLSLKAGRDAAKDAKKDAQVRRALANQAFSPVNFSGPGGSSVTFGGTAQQGGPGGGAQPGPGQPFGFDPETGTNFDGQGNPIAGGLRQVQGARGLKQSDLGSVNASAGSLDPLFDQLAGVAQGGINAVGQSQQGLDPFTQQAFANFLGAGQQGGQTLDLLSQGAGGAFGNVNQQMNQAFQNPFAQGLQQQVLGQSQDAFANLAGTQEQARGQTLDLLRQQAQPFEDRAFSNLQDRQFATGQLGTSGGALQTEAFARGLGQADLQRQLTAGQEGRAAQTAQLGLGTSLSNTGSDLARIQDGLLSGATNRFGAVSNLAQGLQGQRFNQSLTSLQNINQPQIQQNALQSQQLQNILSALGGAQGIGGEARANAGLANQFMATQANARLGASSVSQPVDTSSATALAQLSGALGGGGGIFSGLGNLFGGSNPQPAVGTSFTPVDAAGFSPFN